MTGGGIDHHRNSKSASMDADRAKATAPEWLRALRVYLAVVLIANLVWETLQLPLYSLWTTGTTQKMAFAVVHCTGGDVLIALSALIIALVVLGTQRWPAEGYVRVMLATLVLGVGYTVFSEWLNIIVRSSWAYSDLMPVIPIANIGLSPLLQWILIPAIALWIARRKALEHGS